MANKRSAICEAGKSFLINPNLLFGQGFDDNIFVSPEDLNIYVELTTSKKNRSIIDIGPDDNVEYTSSDAGKAKVSFIDGSPNGKDTVDKDGNKIEGKSLTTSYTELTTVFNKTADTEKFGITSIDIDFNSAYAPLVHIEFVDIRGASLFNAGNPPNSEYSGFFDLPYPIFALKVKGYYGKTVKYCLHLTKWNARFNTTTGNFEISADFIGYTYAMLTDMLLGYLRAITYTPRGEALFLEAKSEMKNPEELITIKELLDKFVDVNEAIGKLSSGDEDIQNLSKNKEISSAVEEIENILKDIMDNIKDSDTSEPDGYALISNADGLIGVRNLSGDTQQSETNLQDINTWKDAMKTQVGELNQNITPDKQYNVADFVGDDAPKYKKDFIYNEILTGTTETNQKQQNFRNEWGLNDLDIWTDFIEKRIIGLSTPNKGVNMTLYDFSKTIKKVNEIKSQINQDEEDLKVEVADKIKQTFVDILGFEPTIGAIFRIFTVHAEIFLACLKEVSEKAEKDESGLRMEQLLGLRDDLDIHKSTSTPEGNLPSKIYPWPLFRKLNDDANRNNNLEEAYLGDPDGGVDIPQNVPELVFVEELLDALMKVAKDDAARQERIDNPNTIIDSWYPVNVLDTPLFGVIQNPYKTDKIGNTNSPLDPLKLMMMRAFTFLGLSNRSFYDSSERQLMGILEANTCFENVLSKTVRSAMIDASLPDKDNADRIIKWFKDGKSENRNVTRKFGENRIESKNPAPLLYEDNSRYYYNYITQEFNFNPITFNGDFDGSEFTTDSGEILDMAQTQKKSILNDFEGKNGSLFTEPYAPSLSSDTNGSIFMKIFSEDEYENQTKSLTPNYVEQAESIQQYNSIIKADQAEYLESGTLYDYRRENELLPKGFNIFGDSTSKFFFNTVKFVDITSLENSRIEKGEGKETPTGSVGVTDLPAMFYINQTTKVGATSLSKPPIDSKAELDKPYKGTGPTSNIEYYPTRFSTTGGRPIINYNNAYINRYGDLGKNRELYKDNFMIPHVDFVVGYKTQIARLGLDNTRQVYSLFGSKLYFEQRRSSCPKAAKAFLFLHTLPWTQLYTDIVDYEINSTGFGSAIFDNNEGSTISNLFDRKSGFLHVPYLWCAFIGGILWRKDVGNINYENDTTNDEDPSGKIPTNIGGSGIYDPIVWGNILSDGNIQPSYVSEYNYKFDNNPIPIERFPRRNEYLTSWDANAPLELDTDGNHKKVEKTLKNLPLQIQREFKRIFIEFSNSSEWSSIRKSYELHPDDWDLPNNTPTYNVDGSNNGNWVGGATNWNENWKAASILESTAPNILNPLDINQKIGTNPSKGYDSTNHGTIMGIKKNALGFMDQEVLGNYEYIQPITRFLKEGNFMDSEITPELYYNWDMGFRNNEANKILTLLFKKNVWVANVSYKSWMVDNAPTSQFKDVISIETTWLQEYVESFCKEWKRLLKLNTEKKEEDELKQQLFNTMDNNTIRLNIYRHCKAIYDKWIAGSQGNVMTSCGQEKKTVDKALASLKRNTDTPRLFDSFRFVNRAFNDLSDTYLLNPSAINEIMTNNFNQSFYDLISRILADNNFNFIALPAFIDFSSKTEMEALFKPEIYSEALAENISGPTFVCVYVGQSSNKLDLGNGSDFPNDGFDFKCAIDEDGNETSQLNASGEGTLPLDFNKGKLDHEHNVIAFAVNYGQQNQNIFTDIKLDQQEFAETDESLQITDSIANNGSQSNRTQAGQNLWNVYQVRSYSAEVTAMGNAMIQPMMYFQLNNIPMFHGGYLIINAKHKITPNYMTTTFKGSRTRYIDTPQVDAESLYMSMLGTLSDVDGATYSPGNVGSSGGSGGSVSQTAIDDSDGLFVRSAGGSTYVWNVGDGFAGKTLRSFMGDLEKYLQKTHPSKKITLGSNGVTRSIEAVIAGGRARSTASKHGAGLAIDLLFGGIYNGKELGPTTGCKKSGLTCYGWVDGNKIVAKDTAIMQSIRTFVDTDSKWKNIIKWGADFGGDATNSGRIKISGFPNNGELRVDEMHHFEIKDGIMSQYIPDEAKTKMTKFGIPIPNKMSDLPALYNYVLKDDASTKGTDQGNGGEGDGVDDEDKIKQIENNGLAGTLSNDRISPLTKEQMKSNLGKI